MDIKDFGFDKFLKRLLPIDKTKLKTRTTATELSGGVLKSQGDIEIGTDLFTLSGEDSNIVVNDGSNDRILIGKRTDGTYGIDVSSSGYSVHEAYESEMDLTSAATDDWTEFDPSAFTYLSSTVLIVNTKYDTLTDFAIGDKVKLIQGGDTKYFYVTQNTEAELLSLKAGTSYTIANETITSIYFSSKSNPYGHPIYFSFTPTIEASGTTVTSQGSEAAKYYFMINGSTLYASYKRTSCTLTAASVLLTDDLPVGRDIAFPCYFVGIGSEAAGTFAVSVISAPTSDAPGNELVDNIQISKMPSANFAAVGFTLLFSIYYKIA